MKLSDYVMQFVADLGAKHVFLVPGGGAMHLNDSLGRQPGLTYIANLHEQASSIAAEAYARVTGGFGVCMVTTGPGSTNAITGLTGAWLDSTPVLFLSGQVKRPDLKAGTGLRQLGVQEIGIVEMVQSVTKYAITITDPESVRFHLEKAAHLARTGRPGPVWIDIPLDVQAAEIDPDTLPGYSPEPEPVTPTAEDLAALARQTLRLLAESERPILMAGNGIRIAGAVGNFERLVDALAIPVQTTWLGLDLIPDDHPLFAGRPGGIAARGANFALQNSDFFLSIGARLDLVTTGYAHERYARAARKVVCDIDPAELRKLNMKINVAVAADAGRFIVALLAVAPEFEKRERRDWFAQIADWRNRYPLTTPDASRDKDKLSAYEFSAALSDAIPEGALIVPSSSGFQSEIFFLMLKIKKGQRCFHNRGTGAMGFAIPSAVGACVASGGQMTVSVDGDGGFQFNSQELATIATHNLPIKMFVVNNNGYASIRASQNAAFEGRLLACEPSAGLRLPDLERLVSAYDLPFERLQRGDDLPLRIRAILSKPGPVICEVITLPDEPREPRLSSSRLPDGSIVSKPLEDLFPFLNRDEFQENMRWAAVTDK